jgi:pimeloyl-ACP methyl ester carboxylesterase
MRERMRENLHRSVREPARFERAMDEILERSSFSPERLRWTVEFGGPAYDVRDQLREIRIPTLIIHGEEDQLVPSSRAHELHEGIDGSRLVLVPKCGHWPHVEQRLRFVNAVREFLGLDEPTRRSPRTA